MAPPRRTTADPRMPIVTERDLAALGVIAEQCAITQPQLARLIDRSEHTARSLRARWQRAGWVEGKVLLLGWPPFIWLTRKGQATCGADYKPWRPSASGRLPHLAACTDARLIVASRRPQAVWTSERELLRTARIIGTPRTRHMPDAEVAVEGRLVAVEVELTSKQQARTEAIARELCARYAAVWYFCTPATAKQLEAIAVKPGFERLQVLALETGGRR
jgi:hypothetical protein